MTGGDHLLKRHMRTEKYNPIPVIIGVGQVNDREEQNKAGAGLNSLDLMEAALRAADADAGGGWLHQLDSLGVVDQISSPELGDVSAPLSVRVGAAPCICYKSGYASGDSPLLLLNEAANRIGAGEIKVAAIVGGEALRTAARRAASVARTLIPPSLRAHCAGRCVSAVRKRGPRGVWTNFGAGSGGERRDLVALLGSGGGQLRCLAATPRVGR
jgi:hypothetical protein